jgi:hypothetical protein
MQSLKERLQAMADGKVSTNSLEQSGELADLSEVEFAEDPINPYGRHLQTITVEVFEKGQLLVYQSSAAAPRTVFIPNKEMKHGKEEEERNGRTGSDRGSKETT